MKDFKCVWNLIITLSLLIFRTVRGSSASEYESGLQKIYTFSTIQGFWAVYNNVPDVKDIQTKCSYHLMRDERRPVWEESYNRSGGAWRFRCNKQDTVRSSFVPVHIFTVLTFFNITRTLHASLLNDCITPFFALSSFLLHCC